MKRSRHLRQDSNDAGVPARAARGAVPPVQPRGAAAAALAVVTFESREPARAVRDIRSGRPARAGRRAAVGAGEEADAVIAWRPSGPARRAGRRAAEAAPTVRYSVQVSTDGGATWQTASFGLTEPEARIDRRLFDDAETVRVRVVTTDGFRRAVTEKTLSVSEL